jgi:PhnB protein
MDVSPYLDFNGDCEAAFTFYEQCLGARVGPIFRYEGTPLADQVPAGWGQKVMHASLIIGNNEILGADVAPGRYEVPKGFSLCLQLGDITEAERVFQQLGTGGTIIVPLAQTFWAARFGMVMDRFGITWVINCDGSADRTLASMHGDDNRAGDDR